MKSRRACVAPFVKILSRSAVYFTVLIISGYIGSTFAQLASSEIKRPDFATAHETPQIPELFPRDKEIELALSAAPEHLRRGAAVYVLERDGFVKVKESTNGFTCIVNRDHPLNQKPVLFRCRRHSGNPSENSTGRRIAYAG